MFLLCPLDLLCREPFSGRRDACETKENDVRASGVTVVNHCAVANLLCIVNLQWRSVFSTAGPFGTGRSWEGESLPRHESKKRELCKINLPVNGIPQQNAGISRAKTNSRRKSHQSLPKDNRTSNEGENFTKRSPPKSRRCTWPNLLQTATKQDFNEPWLKQGLRFKGLWSSPKLHQTAI